MLKRLHCGALVHISISKNGPVLTKIHSPLLVLATCQSSRMCQSTLGFCHTSKKDPSGHISVLITTVGWCCGHGCHNQRVNGQEINSQSVWEGQQSTKVTWILVQFIMVQVWTTVQNWTLAALDVCTMSWDYTSVTWVHVAVLESASVCLSVYECVCAKPKFVEVIGTQNVKIRA